MHSRAAWAFGITVCDGVLVGLITGHFAMWFVVSLVIGALAAATVGLYSDAHNGVRRT